MVITAILLVCCSPARPDFGNLLVRLEVGTHAEVVNAIERLGGWRHGPAVDGLERRLRGEDKQLKALAIEALRKIANRAAVEALIRARQTAVVMGLGDKARSAVRAMPPSAYKLELLSRVGNEQEMRSALGHPEARIRMQAALNLLCHPRNGRVRRAPSRVTVRELAARLQDRSPLVRAAAAQTLGSIGNRAGTALRDLGLRIYDQDIDVRIAAVTALSRIDRGPKALHYIHRGLQDKHKEVREAAREAHRRCTLPRCAR